MKLNMSITNVCCCAAASISERLVVLVPDVALPNGLCPINTLLLLIVPNATILNIRAINSFVCAFLLRRRNINPCTQRDLEKLVRAHLVPAVAIVDVQAADDLFAKDALGALSEGGLPVLPGWRGVFDWLPLFFVELDVLLH